MRPDRAWVDSGRVSFSLEKGRYKVTVSKKGYASLTKKLRVK
jgi:PEGA domain